MSVGVLTTDLGLVVLSWDAALERMTGIRAADAKGRSLEEIVPGLASRPAFQLLKEPLVSGALQVLAPALHKNLIPCPPLEPSAVFTEMQQRVVAGALRDDARVVGLVITIEDVTQRIELEREMAAKLRDADPATRLAAVNRLAAGGSTVDLAPLGSAMRDDHWQVRHAAVRALAERSDLELVEALVTALREGHRDFSLLSSALQLLTLTAADITDALVKLLENEDADLRVQAALALGSQARPAAVDALIKALEDPETNVRFHAIESLGRLEAGKAAEALTQIAESKEFFLAFPAVEALTRINDPSIAPRLVSLLSEPMLAGPVASALGAIGTEEVIPPLVAALDQESAPVGAIVTAIAAVHQRYVEKFGTAGAIEDLVRHELHDRAVEKILSVLPQAAPDEIRSLVTLLSWLKRPEVPRALVRLLGATDIHHEVIEALVRFGAAAVELVIEQLGVLDSAHQRAAIVTLGRIGDRRAVPALIALLEDPQRTQLVATAAALARIGDPRAFEPLVQLLGDPDAAVRRAAIGALNSIGHPEMSRRMLELLRHDDPLVRESAVKISGYFGYPDCAEALVACCADPVETVSAAAIEHLPFLDDARAQELVTGALEQKSARVRAAAARALGGMERVFALPLLRRATSDEDAWVRYFSATSLGRHGDASVVEDLSRLAIADRADHVRVAAVEALGRVGGDEAAALLGLIASEENHDVASAAIAALGRLPSSAVAEPLQRALRSTDARRRAAAARAVATWRNPQAVELLARTASADSDKSIVAEALSGLVALVSHSGDPNHSTIGKAAVNALVTLLTHQDVRAEALNALGRIPPAGIPWLAGHIDADAPDVRRGVVEALGRMAHPSASACLQRALEDRDPVVRRTAVSAVSRLGTRGLAQRLATMASNDASDTVRAAAAAAIGSTKSGGDARQ